MQWRQTAGGSAGTAMAYAARDLERFKGFKRLKAGKRQAAALEHQRLMTRGLGGSCREGFGAF